VAQDETPVPCKIDVDNFWTDPADVVLSSEFAAACAATSVRMVAVFSSMRYETQGELLICDRHVRFASRLAVSIMSEACACGAAGP
jgi:hypothetical protein